ncbi:hypothetical protein [Antrihabitans stalactiti]|uniref:Uncharacterized protein n=1 Tax=Antrihabitans stalactiti TaxID=2584121 RepID=A0A848KL03_9NOCA|nr:hypothetical protein [Antrihabitans stalactiti]NMN98841.1 hypothetical protein [Antrihabitans stalactiti]
MKQIAALGVQAFINDVVQRGGRAERLEVSGRTAVKVYGTNNESCVVQIKAKATGYWHASRRDESVSADPSGAAFWAFIDLGADPRQTFIMPAEEIAADIRCEVDAWMADSPGRSRSGHIGITLDRVAHRRNRWDLLGISNTASGPVEGIVLPPVALRSVAKVAAAEVEEDPRPRLVADYEGYRIVAALDEETRAVEIVAGPMLGRRFDDSTVAATAVASFVSGDVERHDGATFWRAQA